MATASNTQFKVENGLLVVGGNANLDVNTTITSTLSATANLSFTGKVVSNFIPNSDDTYTLGNTSLRWLINASTITANTLNASSNVWVFGTAATFNANTGVANATDVITTQAAHGFSTGEYVQYTTSTGNTALSGLTNASLYYVVSTPSATTLTLSATYGGAQVNITASATSETGHNLTPVRIILSPNGSIFAPANSSIANVGSLRVLGVSTLTGAATLSNTISVTGTATVNGALTVNNTAAVGNTTITGFANVSSTLNVTAAATVNGAFTVNNTAAVGNTTITGFANITSTLTVGGAVTVNGSLVLNNTAALGNTTIAGFANIVGTAATFNALTGVANTTEYITTTSAHGFSNGDLVRYIVSAGNTVVTGLANATNYYVINANTTAFQLSTAPGGAAIGLTATVSQTGHTLTPQRVSLTTAGNIESPIGLANVGSLRVLGAAIVNGTLTVAGNATFDTDLLYLDATNNLIGLKNTAPLSTDLVTVGGNVVFNAANTTGVRLITSNTSYNTSITLMANTTNSRFTFTTWGGSNSSVDDGGYLLNLVNSTSTYAGLLINLNKFEYLSGNVAHKGNFGIYNVSGTRVGP